MKAPKDKYQERKNKYGKLAEKQERYCSIIGYLRLAVFLIGLAISIVLYKYKFYYLCISSVLCTVILFFYVVYMHRRIWKNTRYSRVLHKINEDCLKRFNEDWKSFNDMGEEFIDQQHNYSFDLDIFGRSSLFQWINTAITFLGRQRLKEVLIERPNSSQEILVRQAAVKELVKKLSWRQRFQAEALMIGKESENPEKIFQWLESNYNDILNPAVIALTRILPIITILLGVSYLIGIVKYNIPLLMIFIQVILLISGKSKINPTLKLAERFAEDINAYRNMLKHIETQAFSSEYLLMLKDKLYSKEHISASEQIKRFSRIADSVSGRYNAFYAVLNLILMLDYWYAIELEKWKSKYGYSFRTWLETIGELEYLSSLSVVGHDNPEWVMPKIYEGNPRILAENVGHPLLGGKRVCNDIIIKEPETTILITGSNMSGKSTFLRTVGINLVMAYAGAPVCAEDFSCTLMEIYTSMRVSDNLEKSISSFYAELLKIKSIVKASERGERVFFLLDEIFKGTNSADRHSGATILIKQLSKAGNLGMVSTHDLELGALEKEKEAHLRNYHFTEFYKDNKIYFDYKLKSGISDTRNAVFLMRLAGISIE
ncbi:MAG: DNA mismatch repair protein [Bacillota bacterium]|nr:DNA mismatch repair protein [Bacillota bacterium]